MKRRQTILVLGTLALAAVVTAALFATSPEPPQAAPPPPGVLVETDRAVVENTYRQIAAQGRVRPVRTVEIAAEVTGRIVEVSPGLQPGRIVSRGDLLIRIDPSEYELAERRATGALTQAQAELELERGRQEVAEEEWEFFQQRFEEQAGAASRELALREPQLAAALARVQQAEADWREARLNLERTTIQAPFDAAVQSESAAVGRLVTPQAVIATLVSRGKAWVETSIPVHQLGLIAIPGRNGATEGSPVEVRWDTGTESTSFEGRVIELLPSLSPQGRMAQLLLEVDNRAGGADGSDGGSQLLFDAYVDVTIRSAERQRLVRIPREAVRNGDEVLVFEPEETPKRSPARAGGKLGIARPNIVWRTEEAVLVSEGLPETARVVVSPIANPVEGMLLRTAGQGKKAAGRVATDGATVTDPPEARR